MVTWPSQAPADADPGEEESYRILRSRIDLSRLPKYSRDVTERVIYASADFDYATDLVCDEEGLAAAVAALAAGAPVIVDADMVAAGITGCPVISKISQPLTERLARTAGIPMAAAAVRLAFGEAGPGAVWVVGGAEAKDALRASGLRSVSNVSEKGGAAVAAAALTALLRSALTASG